MMADSKDSYCPRSNDPCLQYAATFQIEGIEFPYLVLPCLVFENTFLAFVRVDANATT